MDLITLAESLVQNAQKTDVLIADLERAAEKHNELLKVCLIFRTLSDAQECDVAATKAGVSFDQYVVQQMSQIFKYLYHYLISMDNHDYEKVKKLEEMRGVKSKDFELSEAATRRITSLIMQSFLSDE